jgi:hypothetical protein
MIFAVTSIQARLENLNTLPGDLSPAQSSNQFLTLAAEHAAANDFDPSDVSVLMQLLGHKKAAIIAQPEGPDSSVPEREIGFNV